MWVLIVFCHTKLNLHSYKYQQLTHATYPIRSNSLCNDITMEKIDDAAVFMCQQSPESLKELEYLGWTLSSPEAFAALLFCHRAAHKALVQGAHSGELEEFWQACHSKITSGLTIQTLLINFMCRTHRVKEETPVAPQVFRHAPPC